MNVPATTYVVRGSSRGTTASVEIASESVAIDARWGVDPSGLPGPADLLAGAFAACLLKNLERSRSLLDFSYESADVEVTARRQDAPPKFVEVVYELTIRTDESPHRVDLVHRNLQKFGTVYNTLAAVCDVHGTVVGVAPGGPAGT